jgi:hypothetical protein
VLVNQIWIFTENWGPEVRDVRGLECCDTYCTVCLYTLVWHGIAARSMADTSSLGSMGVQR